MLWGGGAEQNSIAEIYQDSVGRRGGENIVLAGSVVCSARTVYLTV